MTVYHRLLDPTTYRDKTVPSADSLYEEAQALMFGGADTVGNTLMVGTHRLLMNADKMSKLKAELKSVWPDLTREPSLKELESLPYLNAVIKESLRLSSGVVSGLLRIVPATGATIAGIDVPPAVRFTSSLTHYQGPNGNRQLYHAAPHSYITTPASSLHPILSGLNAGSDRVSWRTGWSRSRGGRGCVWG
jgi:hypothetical protein